MADDKKGGKEKSGKEKKGKSLHVYKHYQVSGDKLQRKNRTCPKCGAGIFLAEHKDRVSCGKCHYMEVKRK